MADEFIQPLQTNVQKKKTKLWVKLLVGAIILFMVTWVIAIAFQDTGTSSTEKKPKNYIQVGNYEFYILEDNTFGTFLTASNQKIPIAFRLDPRQASNISIDSSVVTKILTASKTYIVFNPNEPRLNPAKFAVASAEISRIMGIYGIPIIAAYSEDSNPVNPAVPIKTCNDATNTTVVLVLTAQSMSNAITSDGNCITVAGKNSDDLILTADKLGMHLVGIRL
ncbi:MAG TPA: hypothetical protein HA224_02140 [Nanoarchaeota archaeon]|nr:hypothetical protein [Nanoarchaeota archaeon]